MNVFERRESNVRSYCRSFPAVFTRSCGSLLWDEDGRAYVDFFAGAGVLNYGHNEPHLKQALLRHLDGDQVTHSLDMATGAKRTFLERFEEVVLAPRGLDHRVLFPGPTGTNAVEAALKLARRSTGRSHVVAFTNGFHGMTLGALALTGNHAKRRGAGVPLQHVTHLPFDGYLGPGVDTLDVFERQLEDASGGLDRPAAVVVETVQAEGGVNVASRGWMQRLADLAHRHGVLLVVDDIQVGCGRTGPFFSFEGFDVEPDVICLSKSLSGYGLPFAVTLVKPEHDVLDPGEHNGTFRGNNLAFATATAALERYWTTDDLSRAVVAKGRRVRAALEPLARALHAPLRGRGLIQGLELADGPTARRVSRAAFRRGLVIETAGPRGEVVKVLPPLTIADEVLDRGLGILEEALLEVHGMAPSLTRTKGNGTR
jgi:diaminobutyrate-2-oxoglutarate transaminase